MSELRDIIAAFLAALTRAQHDANRLSARLAERYRKDTLLHYFPVPNALLDDVEAVLRFAVLESEQPPAADSAAPAGEPVAVARQTAVAPALDAARAALAALAGELARAPPPAGQETLVQAVASPANTERLAQQFAAPLRALLQTRVETLLGLPAAPAEQAESTAKGGLRSAVHAVLEASPALAEGAPPREALAARLADAAWDAAAAPIASLAKRIADEVRGERALPSDLNVELATARTSQFPDYALHTLKLHARLRNYKWVIVDKATDQEELLPAD